VKIRIVLALLTGEEANLVQHSRLDSSKDDKMIVYNSEIAG